MVVVEAAGEREPGEIERRGVGRELRSLANLHLPY